MEDLPSLRPELGVLLGVSGLSGRLRHRHGLRGPLRLDQTDHWCAGVRSTRMV